MTSRKLTKLQEEHPKLYPGPGSGTCFKERGFEVPPGWTDLVVELTEELTSNFEDVECLQVKEKMGSLAYYFEYHGNEVTANHRIRKLISEYERKSAYTCPVCGDSLVSKETVNAGWGSKVCKVHK